MTSESSPEQSPTDAPCPPVTTPPSRQLQRQDSSIKIKMQLIRAASQLLCDINDIQQDALLDNKKFVHKHESEIRESVLLSPKSQPIVDQDLKILKRLQSGGGNQKEALYLRKASMASLQSMELTPPSSNKSFHHPNLEYVMAEMATSPYQKAPSSNDIKIHKDMHALRFRSASNFMNDLQLNLNTQTSPDNNNNENDMKNKGSKHNDNRAKNKSTGSQKKEKGIASNIKKMYRDDGKLVIDDNLHGTKPFQYYHRNFSLTVPVKLSSSKESFDYNHINTIKALHRNAVLKAKRKEKLSVTLEEETQIKTKIKGVYKDKFESIVTYKAKRQMARRNKRITKKIADMVEQTSRQGSPNHSAELKENSLSVYEFENISQEDPEDILMTVSQLQDLSQDSLSQNSSLLLMANASQAGLLPTEDVLNIQVDDHDPVLTIEADDTPKGLLVQCLGKVLYSQSPTSKVITRPASAGFAGIGKSQILQQSLSRPLSANPNISRSTRNIPLSQSHHQQRLVTSVSSPTMRRNVIARKMPADEWIY